MHVFFTSHTSQYEFADYIHKLNRQLCFASVYTQVFMRKMIEFANA